MAEERFEFELTKGIDEIIKSLDETNKELATLSFSDDYKDNLLDTLDFLNAASSENARIITLDKANDNKEITALTITNGKGNVLLDKEYQESEKEEKREKLAEDILSSTKDASCIVVKDKESLDAINRAIREYKEKNGLPIKDLTSAWIKDRVISFSRIADTIENLVKRWNEPLLLQVFHAVSLEVSSRRRDQYKIHFCNGIYRSWAEKETERKEMVEALKEVKKEEKISDKTWIPIERTTAEWKQLPLEEQLVEKELVKRFPENIPSHSSWEKFRDLPEEPKGKATNKEVAKVRTEIKQNRERERKEAELTWLLKKDEMFSRFKDSRNNSKTKTRTRMR